MRGFTATSAEVLRLAELAGVDSVRCWVLPQHLRATRDGQADVRRRIVYLAPDAPWMTAAHEVAHLVTDSGHDQVWADEFVRLAVASTS